MDFQAPLLIGSAAVRPQICRNRKLEQFIIKNRTIIALTQIAAVEFEENAASHASKRRVRVLNRRLFVPNRPHLPIYEAGQSCGNQLLPIKRFRQREKSTCQVQILQT